MDTDTYKEEVPDHVDKDQEEWNELSYHTQYYHCNEDRRETMRENSAQRRKDKKEWLNDLKESEGCHFCSVDTAICLDFHHQGDKDANISRLVTSDYSKEKIKEEISKCIVICANCHRKLHAGIITTL